MGIVGKTKGEIFVGGIHSPGDIRFVGLTSAAADPTTTEFPNNRDWGFHWNTSSNAIYIVYNFSSEIKKVELEAVPE
jgi:hypothetical protein